MAKTTHEERVHRAADFYEPRMAVAFVRSMEELQNEVTIDALTRAIEHRHAVLTTTAVEKAVASSMKVGEKAALKGAEIGLIAMEEL